VKVQIQNPDAYLRPEMNASVRFSEPAQAGSGVSYRPLVRIPASALHDGSVFIVLNGKATRREVQAGTTSAEGVEIISGLIGGEAVIVEAPAGLKDGQQVKIK